VVFASAGTYASVHLAPDNHASTPPLRLFTGRMPFLLPNQQCQSTEGTSVISHVVVLLLFLYKSYACLLNYHTCFSLTYSLPYLPTSLRIVPFCVQARCHKRRRNLAFVFFVFILCCVLLWMDVCFSCLI